MEPIKLITLVYYPITFLSLNSIIAVNNKKLKNKTKSDNNFRTLTLMYRGVSCL